MSTNINPRYVFPAPGWKCFQCSIHDESTVEFWEIPIVGWSVVEGYECGEELCKLSEENCYLTHGSNLQLLVALQDGALESPMIVSSSELDDWLTNAAFGFLPPNEEFDDEYKDLLERKARKKWARDGKVAA